MATPLKYMYNPAYFESLCPVLHECVSGFDSREFVFRVFNNNWPDMELKERVRHISNALHPFLDKSFPAAAQQLICIARTIMEKTELRGFSNIFLPDYIEIHGLEYPDDALDAFEEITKLVSAEFGIRPFIARYPDKVMKRMLRWALSDNKDVRRLASEGCRPRLPWAMALPDFKADPSPVLPILEKLKDDPSEYVRKSVANNLNDIAKDHPDVVLGLARKWIGQSPRTNWIIKHGCRSLLKKGDDSALSLHGFNPKSKARVRQLLHPGEVKIGESLDFTFAFVNAESLPTPFRIEYAIDYLTSTGKKSTKVFKLKENLFKPGESVIIKRKQSFRDFTTRKHFPGKHRISILANGKKIAASDFTVV